MKYLFLLGCSLAVATPALAQGSKPEEWWGADLIDANGEYQGHVDGRRQLPEDEITVTATGLWGRKLDTGQAISVLTAQDIARTQGADLTRLLERFPGVSFSRNGGLGAQTGLNVRGANADQLLVLIDGVRIADYASPGGGYDLGNLLSGNVQRIELLRGSNSVIWGSQAIGGVLAIDTGAQGSFGGSLEFGGYDTLATTAYAGIGNSSYRVDVAAGYARTDGFSAQAGGTEADGYEQWNVSGTAELDLSDSLTLRAVGRHADSTLAIDLLGPNSPDEQATRETTGRIGLDFEIDGFTLSAGAVYSNVRRDYQTGFGPSSFTGRSWRPELRGRYNFNDDIWLDFGADTDWTRSTSSFDPAATARQSSGHALFNWSTDTTLIAAGVRIDDHDRFGTHATFGANGRQVIYEDWHLRASFGEGFKAPTLYQLNGSFVGNAALQPETSRSFDIGIEKGDRRARMRFALSAFRRDSRDLIDLDSAFVYQNVARARAEGFELELDARVTQQFRARAAYTWLKARDLTNNRDLARRPRHALSLSADWTTSLAGLALGADLRLQGDSVEYNFAGTPIPLDGFVVATLRASLPLGERFELYGRVENIGGVSYETAAGFNSPGRSAYAGVRVRW